jgi:hypothetical protein
MINFTLRTALVTRGLGSDTTTFKVDHGGQSLAVLVGVLKRELHLLAVLAVIGTFTRPSPTLVTFALPNCLPITPAHLPDGRLSSPGGWLIATAVLCGYGGGLHIHCCRYILFSWRLFQASHYAL